MNERMKRLCEKMIRHNEGIEEFTPEDMSIEDVELLAQYQLETVEDMIHHTVREHVRDHEWEKAYPELVAAWMALGSILFLVKTKGMVLEEFEDVDTSIPDFMPDDLREQWVSQFGGRAENETNESSTLDDSQSTSEVSTECTTDTPDLSLSSPTDEPGGQTGVEFDNNGGYRWRP